jgi:sugar lactone lactonase YvrE
MRNTILTSLLVAFALGGLPVMAQEVPTVTTVASYPHGAFLENLSVDPEGRLLFTSYFDMRLMAWDGAGEPAPLVTLDVHPVAVLARADDIILSAHGKSFADGPAFTATNQLLVLDRKGAVTKRVAAPDALFLNGMVEIAPDILLVADSLAGKIWRFDVESGAISTWLADPLLAADPAKPSQKPGANGLKVHDGWLYISNSARGTIHRVALDGDLPQGPLELFATPGSVDDFTFLADGTIAAASHGRQLFRIGQDGQVTDILADGCDACTSVATFGPEADLIVLTTGNLVEGGDAPARVLRMASPVN